MTYTLHSVPFMVIEDDTSEVVGILFLGLVSLESDSHVCHYYCLWIVVAFVFHIGLVGFCGAFPSNPFNPVMNQNILPGHNAS